MVRARHCPIQFTLFDSAFGPCAIAWSDQGVVRLQLPEASAAATRSRVRAALGDAEEIEPPERIERVTRKVTRHLGGAPTRFDAVPLDLDGASPFAQQVYESLRRVEPGTTVTYGELAARAGRPGASRAVGQVMARNPLPVIVPCHRVLAADGKPGGFSAYGGTLTKARLLFIEGVSLDAASLFDGQAALPFDGAAARRHLIRVDPELGTLIKQVGALRLTLKPPRSTFEALAEAIVYQQLSGKAAATIYSRLRALFPKRRTLRAEDVVKTSDETLRTAGLSRAKTAALRDLANKAVAGQLPTPKRLAKMNDEAIIETLSAVRGVGRWTVEMLLIFQLGRPDVLPVADHGIRKGYARAFGLSDAPPSSQVAERGERWRPWRSVASWYLWRALELP